MPIGSKELIVENLDKIEDSLLVEELKKAKEELFNLRFQSATGQLESHGRLRAVKRDISRIYTIIRERELGIRAIPAPGATLPPKAKKAEKPVEAAAETVAADAVTEEAKTEKPAAKKSSKTETKES
jgi:large subunit ribosomal protein L29